LEFGELCADLGGCLGAQGFFDLFNHSTDTNGTGLCAHVDR
jgi:hypothetical protein